MVAHAVVNMLISPEGAEVDPIGAIEGLCIATAMVAENIGASPDPEKRQQLVDWCAGTILSVLGKYDEFGGTIPDRSNLP